MSELAWTIFIASVVSIMFVGLWLLHRDLTQAMSDIYSDMIAGMEADLATWSANISRDTGPIPCGSCPGRCDCQQERDACPTFIDWQDQNAQRAKALPARAERERKAGDA